MLLWALGSNSHSQLSLDHLQDVSTPALCVLPDSLAQDTSIAWTISCGGNHTLLLTGGGDLYGCGSNEYHQLGLPDTSDVMSIRRLHSNKKWRFVTCGFSFSILVSSEDEVFATGTCSKGSLGLGPDVLATQDLRKLSLPIGRQRITGLVSGISHVVLQTSDGTLFGMGSGRKGALGTSILGNMFLPRSLDHEPRGIEKLVAGRDWTAVLSTERITLLGSLGRLKITIPEDFDSSSVSEITSNWSTLHCLKTSGEIQSFGRSDRGQYPPPGQPKLTTLAGGSEHSAGIGEDGRVYVWGWNEHGNCGSGLKDVTSVRALEVPRLGKVKGVSAGCGTTFIYGDPL